MKAAAENSSFEWGPEITAGVIIGLMVAAIIGLAVWAWKNRREPAQRLAQRFAVADQRVQRAEADRLPEMRAQVGRVAKERGIRLAMKATGSGNPTTVTWADGSMSQHYADFQTYRREMQAGRADHRRAHHGAFTSTPVSRWDKPRLRTWLAEHAD